MHVTLEVMPKVCGTSKARLRRHLFDGEIGGFEKVTGEAYPVVGDPSVSCGASGIGGIDDDSTDRAQRHLPDGGNLEVIPLDIELRAIKAEDLEPEASAYIRDLFYQRIGQSYQRAA